MSVTLTPSVVSPRAKVDVVSISVAGLDSNDIATFDPATYPSEDEIRCYIAFLDANGAEQGRSYVFAASQSGKHVFNSYIFPDDGSWTMSLRNAATDEVIKDQAITVA